MFHRNCKVCTLSLFSRSYIWQTWSPTIEGNEDRLFTEFSSFCSLDPGSRQMCESLKYIADDIPERISFESVDDSRSTIDLEILKVWNQNTL